jgi:hypothetical protein
VTDFAVTPDSTRLIAVGMQPSPPSPSIITSEQRSQSVGSSEDASPDTENRILVYNLGTKQIESYVVDHHKLFHSDKRTYLFL